MTMTDAKQFDWLRESRRIYQERRVELPFLWDRVSQSKPCVVCGKPDWCTRERHGRYDCCMRIESDRPASNGGWLHNESIDRGQAVELYSVKPERPTLDVWSVLRTWSATHPMIAILADQLGVTFDSLRRLHTHYNERTSQYGFPMWDCGKAVGIRTRNPDGTKRSVKHSRAGLFLADDDWTRSSRERDPVLIAEGPTDAAALMSMGYDAVIGRPSCRGQHRLVRVLVRATGRHAVIVADHDGPGRQGAVLLANDLTGVSATVRIVVPPRGNDIRDWYATHGGTKEALDFLIRNARFYREQGAKPHGG